LEQILEISYVPSEWKKMKFVALFNDVLLHSRNLVTLTTAEAMN